MSTSTNGVLLSSYVHSPQFASDNEGATSSASPQRRVILARPGAGKSTLAARLADELGVTLLSTGTLLREEVEASSDMGQQIVDALGRGDLVDDGLVISMIGPRLEVAASGGYLLDGFPRNLVQLAAFDAVVTSHAQPQVVLSLEVSSDVCRDRLLARAAREGRSDDSPSVIEHGLAAFEQNLVPVLERYEKRALLIRVDGEDRPDVVARRALLQLGFR